MIQEYQGWDFQLAQHIYFNLHKVVLLDLDNAEQKIKGSIHKHQPDHFPQWLTRTLSKGPVLRLAAAVPAAGLQEKCFACLYQALSQTEYGIKPISGQIMLLCH